MASPTTCRVPDIPLDGKGTEFALPGGYIENGELASYKPIKTFNDKFFIDGVAEAVKHSWYDYKEGNDKSLHPYKGETKPNYTDFQDDGKYTWLKSPTFYGKPMQVGPLSRVLNMLAAGHEPTTKYATGALELVSSIAGRPRSGWTPCIRRSAAMPRAPSAARCNATS